MQDRLRIGVVRSTEHGDEDLIHRDQGIRAELEKVMPGVTWKTWDGRYGNPSQGATAKTAAKIAEFLSALPSDVTQVSSRKLKVDAGLGDIPQRTFTASAQQVGALVPWCIQGRSFVRLFDAAELSARSL